VCDSVPDAPDLPVPGDVDTHCRSEPTGSTTAV
jgi:hypothetical protein